MKDKYLFSWLPIVACLLVVLPAPANDDAPQWVRAIEVNAANDFIAQHDNAVILDVRTPVEYEMSHIDGSVNVNVQDDSFEALLEAMDPNKTYIVHCTKNPADGRSNRALETMKSLGFKDLYSLEGGYIAWQDAALPMTPPTKDKP